MNGARSFFVWFDTTDVNRISDRANTKAYSSIRIDFQYCVRPTKWCFILVLGTLAQHYLVIDVICFRFCCSLESNVVYMRGCTPSLQCVGY